MIGTVLCGTNNVFEVECKDGIQRLCTIKGKKLKASQGFYNPLCPGDSVVIEENELTETAGQIVDLNLRKNSFVRWNIKKRAPQLLAANLDALICVCTPDEPPFRPRFIDRALAQAEHAQINPIIVCNKWDLVPTHHSELDIEHRLSIWEKLDYPVIKISAQSGEGLSELVEHIEGKTVALVGQSGVGKSSIINKLDASCVLKTGSLSEKYGRGTHTTTKGVLLRLEINESLTGGRQSVYTSVIDTPGVRRFILNDVEAHNLALYFKEMRPFVGTCGFGMSCNHNTEPNCALLQAVQDGTISPERYESWQRLKEEIETGNWAD